MPRSSDLNLLYGILALQLDFIRQNELIEAMQDWVNRKSVPLGEILVQRRSLVPENHQLLAALVQNHLKQHNDDPEESLAAISSINGARDELKQLIDSDIQTSLSHLSDQTLQETNCRRDPLSTVESAGQATSKGLRFRILRPHARGGLGIVSVASDTELNREVALKEIQSQYADDPDHRGRFMLEAEITGRLEHPGIVPVYGLGTYEDGRPFYAMRFIRGYNLQEELERFHGQSEGETTRHASNFDSLAFRQILGRFIDVCDAVAYAHSRGILHRDLKPGNIMLGKYGETLVVDWGLAKSLGKGDRSFETSEPPLATFLGAGSAPTVTGSTVGTLAYMSQEQACGRLDQLGPATDIYALGATLYHILTGHAPHYGDDAAEILRRIADGDFPAARSKNRHVPAPLSAICKRAMALLPADRYATALALSSDIEHFLADEPTSAYRESLYYRARRWSKRHLTLVAASTILILATLFLATLALVMNQFGAN